MRARKTEGGCGCRANDKTYTSMCAPCKAEFDERHAQAHRDYRAQEDQRKAAKPHKENK